MRDWKQETVPRARLAHGVWNHKTNHEDGEGDICAAYSADTIANTYESGKHGGSKIRTPFHFSGAIWTTTQVDSHGGAEAYRLVCRELFEGEPTTYAKKVYVDGGETAREDPQGFYHGMTVKHGGREFVMVGPPVCFLADGPQIELPGLEKSKLVPEQQNLF